jgi:hypothetical protein
MNRALALGLLLCVAGCRLPAERVPLRSLPEDVQPLPYGELLTRARLQATAATEAFYINQWTDLEDAARGLEQTAQFLGKALEVPANHKDSLAGEADTLREEASKLREAAKTREVKQTNEILQRINLKVRELRPEG